MSSRRPASALNAASRSTAGAAEDFFDVRSGRAHCAAHLRNRSVPPPNQNLVSLEKCSSAMNSWYASTVIGRYVRSKVAVLKLTTKSGTVRPDGGARSTIVAQPSMLTMCITFSKSATVHVPPIDAAMR